VEEEGLVDLLKIMLSLIVCTFGLLDFFKLDGKFFGKNRCVINMLAKIVLQDLSMVDLIFHFR